MSQSVQLQHVVFPNQQAIIDYIVEHPLKESINTFAIESIIPNSIQKVSQYFADKIMPRDQIAKNVRTALADESLISFLETIQKLTVENKEIASGSPYRFTENVKTIYTSVINETDPLFETAIRIYETVLKDLTDGAWYTPPSTEAEFVIVSHIEQIN